MRMICAERKIRLRDAVELLAARMPQALSAKDGRMVRSDGLEPPTHSV